MIGRTLDTEPWYDNIPYGPLTRENHDDLSLYSYDLPRSEITRVAEARGVAKGDYKRVRFAEMAVQQVADLILSPQSIAVPGPNQ
ncbi:MAG TPA: hypothetical protein VNG32_02190 [Candidatus Dormibacteraeota bacterium]|nr:hypothetical protein [Candidatus Dormibacteraeota bacterium]